MNWYQKTPATGPNLQAYGAAYDSARGVTVFAGGIKAGVPAGQSTTFEWDGSCFTEITTAHFPTNGRHTMGLAYDKARAKTVLFGGFEVSRVDQDTWTYDGTDWTQVFPTHKPSFRSTSMVYDEVNDVIVLFGGSDGSSQLGDTWLWNGTDWTQVFPAHSPPPCGDGMMLAWDPINGNVVFFGGNSPYIDDNETWTWNGTDWTHHSPVTSPPGRRYGAFGGISGVGAVLYGGFQEGIDNVYDTWLWTGTDWVDLDPVDHPSEGFGQDNQYLVDSPDGGAVFLVGGMVWDWTPNLAPGRWLYATSYAPPPEPPFQSPDQFVYRLLDAYTGELYVLADVWICQETIDALTFDESDEDQNFFGVADWYGEASHFNPFPPVDWCELGNVTTLFLAGDAPFPVAPYWESAFGLSPRLDITAGLHTIGVHVSIPHLTATIVVDDHSWSDTISGFQSQIDAIYFGAQAQGCFGNTADPITNMTNIRVGTTCWGSTDIVFDNFETNDFSKWDGVQGTPHIIPRPICVARGGALPMFHSGPHYKNTQ